jgi:hypothetical protein
LQDTIKVDIRGVAWQQFVRQDGESAANGHEGGRDDQAAKVCDVRVRERGRSRDPSARPTRKYAAIYSRARRGGEKETDSAIGVSWRSPSGATGERNGFASLKTLADKRECPADCGVER